MDAAKYIWMNGEFVAWDDAKVHVLSHTLHYGNGVIEGTKAYKTEKGYAIFRLNEHTARLKESAKMTLIDIPYSVEEMNQAQIDLVRKNEFIGDNVYIRPFAFLGYGVMGVYHKDAPVETVMSAWEWGAYMGEENLTRGIKIATSSYTRHHVNVTMTKAKSNGSYMNSMLALQEAISHGCDEALLLDVGGYVAEGSGENFFMVKDGALYTPELTCCLDGITRKTIMKLAKELGIEVIEKKITRDEVYIADEAFFTGTAAEVTPIRELDNRPIGIGSRGPITEKLQSLYFDIVHGRSAPHLDWLTTVAK